MAKSKIYIICGTCGNDQDLSFEITKLSKLESEDNGGKIYSTVIKCPNCSTIHDLNEFLKQE